MTETFRELVLELCASELNRRALAPVGRIVREALAARQRARNLREEAGRKSAQADEQLERRHEKAAQTRRRASQRAIGKAKG